MTRPSKSSLVLDGAEIKARLLAERSASNSSVHVDWVRFTCLLRNAPAPAIDDLFPIAPPPGGGSWAYNVWDNRAEELRKILISLPDADFAASAQAKDLAVEVAQSLGPDYTVAPEVRKGYDFYRFRWSIERNGVECGWVGYLVSGDSPRQQSQARTIHCNLYGAACTFADYGTATSSAPSAPISSPASNGQRSTPTAKKTAPAKPAPSPWCHFRKTFTAGTSRPACTPARRKSRGASGCSWPVCSSSRCSCIWPSPAFTARERCLAGQRAARAAGKTWGKKRALPDDLVAEVVTAWRSGWYDQKTLADMVGCSISVLRDHIHRHEGRGRWAAKLHK